MAGGVGDSQTEYCLSALADELLWREIGHWKPSDVIRQFCAQHPTCTLPMISGIHFHQDLKVHLSIPVVFN